MKAIFIVYVVWVLGKFTTVKGCVCVNVLMSLCMQCNVKVSGVTYIHITYTVYTIHQVHLIAQANVVYHYLNDYE